MTSTRRDSNSSFPRVGAAVLGVVVLLASQSVRPHVPSHVGNSLAVYGEDSSLALRARDRCEGHVQHPTLLLLHDEIAVASSGHRLAVRVVHGIMPLLLRRDSLLAEALDQAQVAKNLVHLADRLVVRAPDLHALPERGKPL